MSYFFRYNISTYIKWVANNIDMTIEFVYVMSNLFNFGGHLKMGWN